MENVKDDLVVVDIFELRQLKLLGLDVNEFTNKKNGLTYLSWANAWGEFIKVFPKTTYIVKKDEYGNPYFGDPRFGFMVFTSVNVMGIEREMWLPVMDGANKSLKAEPYEYEGWDYVWNAKERKKVKTRVIKKVDAINMFDINKTIMRCLTKNLAMFGVGLYIYKGEDLPEEIIYEGDLNRPVETTVKKKATTMPKELSKANVEDVAKVIDEIVPITDKQKARIHILLEESSANKKNVYNLFKIRSSTELNFATAEEMIKMLTSMKIRNSGKIDTTQISQILALLKEKGFSKKSFLEKRGVEKIDDLSYKDANDVLSKLLKMED